MNGLQQEVAYATLSSAPAIWEVEVKNKWKMLNMELASWLEEKWRIDIQRVYLDDFMEVSDSSSLLEFKCQHNVRICFRDPTGYS